MHNSTPKMSALLVTYNQEHYVRAALDGVLMQKTDFDVEIIIADDYSTDATPAIIADYANKHPNIRVLPNHEGHIGITRNFQRGFAASRGTYIAVLEGDDYWINPNKLKIVSGFLDQHQQCSFCFHRMIKHDETSDKATVYPIQTTPSHFFTASDLAKANSVGGFSTCTYRREVINSLNPELWKMKVREWPFNIVVATHGPAGYIPEILSVYRAHPGGIWSQKTAAEGTVALLELIESYNKFLDFKFEAEFREFKQKLSSSTIKSARSWLAAKVPTRLKLEIMKFLKIDNTG